MVYPDDVHPCMYTPAVYISALHRTVTVRSEATERQALGLGEDLMTDDDDDR